MGWELGEPPGPLGVLEEDWDELGVPWMLCMWWQVVWEGSDCPGVRDCADCL